MAGGKGGSTTSKVTVPAWLEQAAQGNLARANQVSQIGYTPYYGLDVAAMTPTQIASMQNTGQAASAFGLGSADPMAGMPQSQTFAGGVQGYSSAPMYQQSVNQFAAQNPGQAAEMENMFINPQTGQMAGATPAVPVAPTAPVSGGRGSAPINNSSSNYSGNTGMNMPAPVTGGYTGIGDFLNGGGPNNSGTGLLSGVVNTVAGTGGKGSGMGGGK